METNRIRPLENETRGRVLSVLGYLLGEMSIDPDTQDIKSESSLEEAVDLCKQGYDLLKDSNNEAAELLGLNNLVLFSSILGQQKPEKILAISLLAQARRLKVAAVKRGSSNLLLTACRVILQYSKDAKERDEACSSLATLAAAATSIRERKEAALYARIFCTP